ncbi:alpha/beta-hydrolase [Hysterangium stoloniferum]|nr:alpha/beta-hydrolase [Hysterangium stoloniferum]
MLTITCLTAADVFIPLLAARISEIAKTPKKTFTFGPTERHQVDIYYPPEGTSDAPILFFVYGGRFVMGSRTVIPGLSLDNIGAFFAQRGIFTAIADYRLAPQFTYPAPVEDIRDAIKFTLSSPEVDATKHGANKDKVYVMGHSAGGTHTATLFLNEDILRTEDERAPLKGMILMGTAFEALPHFAVYYGPGELAPKTPLGLLKSKTSEKLKQLLPSKIFILVSERDPEWLHTVSENFKAALRSKEIVNIREEVMKGHNHISVQFNLSSGEGEEWGEQVAEFIKA